MREDISLSIKRLPETGEWKVVVKKDGVYNEDASAYQDDPEDAVNTLISMAKTYVRGGHNTKILGTATTKDLFARYGKTDEMETIAIGTGPGYFSEN